MIDTQLRNAAETFIEAMKGSPEMITYLRAKLDFENSPELIELRRRFRKQAKQLQSKEVSGTLTQEEIDTRREIQNSVNGHPLTVKYIQARKTIIGRLQECNAALSAELGFDFASAAAPQLCCG